MKAIITGASSGMGKYFAIELAKRGYDIVVTARREEKLKELVEIIESETKQSCEYVITDLSLEKDVKKLNEIIKKEQEINFLINNAGVGYFGNAVDLDSERVNKLVKLNVESLTSLTIEANKVFIKRGEGRIMNVSSIVSYMSSMPSNAPYVASKRYVDAFSKSINYENRKLKNKVRVITLRPGAIATEWAKQATTNKKNDPYDKNIFATDPSKFAKKVIRKSLRKRNVITQGAGGYTSKILSPISSLLRYFMYRYGNKASKM